MTCTVCGTEVQPKRHDFFEGIAPESVPKGQEWRPVRQWSYGAALYHRTDVLGPTAKVIANFCGADCSLRWHAP